MALPSPFRSQKAGIFVDVQSVYLACHDKHPSVRVDYESLLREVLDGRPCVRALAYLQYQQEPDVHGFSRAMNEKGFEVRSKPLKDFKGNPLSWAVGMTLDMVDMKDRLDVAVLVTHDPEFEETVRYLHTHGLMVEVWGMEEFLSPLLKRAASKFHFLSKNILNHDPGHPKAVISS